MTNILALSSTVLKQNALSNAVQPEFSMRLSSCNYFGLVMPKNKGLAKSLKRRYCLKQAQPMTDKR